MTHVYFDSDKINWDSYLRSQQTGEGTRMSGRGPADLHSNNEADPYFKGLRYMRGYGAGKTIKGALGSLGRFLLPIASNILETAGREADDTIGRIGSDLVQGKPVFGAVKEQTTKGLSNIGRRIQQCGKGRSGRAKGTKPKKHVGNIALEAPITIKDMNNLANRTMQRKRRRDYLDL